MNQLNDSIRDFIGVSLWHQKGYTGTRGKTATGEPFDGENATGHAVSTKFVFNEIAPDREVVYIPYTTKGFTDELPTAVKSGVDTMFLSMMGTNQGEHFDQAIEPYADRFTMFICAGNYGVGLSNAMIKAKYTYGVGAIAIGWSITENGLPIQGATLYVDVPEYSSRSEDVDFCAPTNLYETTATFGGTSCATPVLCGMAALVNDFFIDKTGRPLSSEAMYQFMKDHSVDIREPGHDDAAGWGYPVLPDPDTIDIWKYQKKEEEPIVETTVTKTGVTIIETDWDWAYSLSKRNATTELIIHHAAGNGSAEQIHNLHLDKGWTGIAYNYYVRKDGKIYRGRPEDAIGGHSSGNHNQISIGICFEGNFQTDIMGEAQFNAGSMLVADILSRYPNLKVLRHGDINSTACPGKNFPFEEMTENMTGKEIYEKLSIYLAELDESPWSQDEGTWRKAIDAGVVDGTNPRGYITREQMTALLGRLNLI